MAENNSQPEAESSAGPKEGTQFFIMEVEAVLNKYQKAYPNDSDCSSFSRRRRDNESPTQPEGETYEEVQSQVSAGPEEQRQPSQHRCSEEPTLEQQLEDPKKGAQVEVEAPMEVEAMLKKYQMATPHAGDCGSCSKEKREDKEELTTQPEGETHMELQSPATAGPMEQRQPSQHPSSQEPTTWHRLQYVKHLIQREKEMTVLAESNRDFDKNRLHKAEYKLKKVRCWRQQQEEELLRLRDAVKNLKLSSTAPSVRFLDELVYNYKIKEELIKELVALHILCSAKENEIQAEQLQAEFFRKEVEKVRLKLDDKVSKDTDGIVSNDTDNKVSIYTDERLSKDTEDKMSKDTDNKVSQDTDNKVSQDTDDKVSNDTDNKVSKNTDDKMSNDAEDKVSKDADDIVSKDTDDKVSQDIDDKVSQDTDDKVFNDADDKVSQDTDNKVSKDADDKVSQDTDDKVSKDIDDIVSQDTDYIMSKDTLS